MNFQRNFLIFSLLLISFIIWQSWKEDQSKINIENIVTLEKKETFFQKNKNIETNINNKNPKIITVKTDVLSLEINSKNGDIENAFLLSYKDNLKSNKPFCLLQNTSNFIYQAKSSLLINDLLNNTKQEEKIFYNFDKDNYILLNNEKELYVPFKCIKMDGTIYTKTFIFKRGSFSIDIIYNIKNKNIKPIEVTLYCKLLQSFNSSDNVTVNNYKGVAYSSEENKYQKYSLNNIKEKNLYINTKGGWIAMLQQYFTVAWIPCTNNKNILFTDNLNNKEAIIGFKSSPIIVQPNNYKELKTILWLGPDIQEEMLAIAPNLDLTVDYGWLWFISQPLFKLLKFIYNYVGNWGLSIIIITLIVRILMYPLTKTQYISMAKIKILQPKLNEIREKFNNDKQRQSQEIITLYKNEKVNPLGGCLPLIIQMPIFLALYYMLSESIELRHASFFLWIHDLSSYDPYYILPIIMGITMFFIQKLSPSNISDPLQQKIINYMPVIFTMFFLWFPSGLVLYYIISNLITIIQQKIIYNNLEKKGLYIKNK